MNKQFSKEEITHLNSLLDETLANADKEQLIRCIKMLATAVASLKIRYQADEEKVPEIFKQLLTQVDDDDISVEVGQIMSKTIIECATAMAVAKKNNQV